MIKILNTFVCRNIFYVTLILFIPYFAVLISNNQIFEFVIAHKSLITTNPDNDLQISGKTCLH